MDRPVVLLAIGFAFGWLGPYGTYTELGLVQRFAFWMIAVTLIGLLSGPVMRMLARTARGASWPRPVRMVAAALIVGIPGTLVVIALHAIFQKAPPPISAADYARLYVSVTAVIALVGIPLKLMRARRSAEPPAPRPMAPTPSSAASVQSPFLRRIPAKLGSELLCIATEDHYLRIITDIGSDLLLFRLSDAIAELDPAVGQQVHRSYWVARRAVVSIERNGHRTWLILANGTQIPVSRTYLPALRAAGWFMGTPITRPVSDSRPAAPAP